MPSVYGKFFLRVRYQKSSFSVTQNIALGVVSILLVFELAAVIVFVGATAVCSLVQRHLYRDSNARRMEKSPKKQVRRTFVASLVLHPARDGRLVALVHEIVGDTNLHLGQVPLLSERDGCR